MTRPIAIAAALLPILVGAPSTLMAQGSDSPVEEVRAAVDSYLRAHATGDASHIRSVFHPMLDLFFVRNGEFATRTGEDYMNGMGGEPAANEAERRRWIASIDVTGTAAVAKVVLDYPGALITDYFTLLEIDGEWRIMNKIFHVEPK